MDRSLVKKTPEAASQGRESKEKGFDFWWKKNGGSAARDGKAFKEKGIVFVKKTPEASYTWRTDF